MLLTVGYLDLRPKNVALGKQNEVILHKYYSITYWVCKLSRLTNSLTILLTIVQYIKFMLHYSEKKYIF